MEILGKYGKEDLAILYIARYDEKVIEFVESVQPPVSREQKWVLILSTLYGCPLGCLMCDAGEYFFGEITKEGMIAQIDHMISPRFPDRKIPIPKLKIQFARMGEPTLNENVLELLRELPKIYDAPGLMPCVSTVAPSSSKKFLNDLISIKNNLYPPGQFQLQFSIHSTDPELRHKWIPGKIWSFQEIADFGEKWYKSGDRKITLNFAVAKDSKIEPKIIAKFFDPLKYFIKLTPLNPTSNVLKHKLDSGITKENVKDFILKSKFEDLGYKTMISIGNWEENEIGSNCGQFATQYIKGDVEIKKDYTCNDYNLLN
ncbi:radical SAM protein [Promethearchaeum syntrophicum]|uniref:Radical SAM protein n=1 Tax=Promethearchaeum syntrophicum TaxID=2594042 RepID=A0A5B9DA76_9ARCH|nr:radical SAM protein [Candidatus Prometheoarchaeum syntrophicum]QEE15476.1 Dual-specificity RNA methyltransferase RlmN [Candidatus Prometheoarchaeum syntrophicum]